MTSSNNAALQAGSLTVEQALQQAVAHHRAGRLQDAERLYRAILGVQPNHPDANHNLGALAAHVGQSAAALPHFKAALEANPDQAHFWLSYIDALIQAGQTSVARQILEQARQRGLQGGGIEELADRLEEATKTDPASQEENTLIALFAEERYAEAATLAQAITERRPTHGIGWKALGVALHKMGRSKDALAPMQRAAALLPNDAEVYSNLGVILRDVGRFNDATSCHRKALKIKPDLAEAHNNLGNVLLDLKQLDDAVACYRKALSLEPDYAEAHNNLGSALQDLWQLDDAVACYRKALSLEPDYAEAHSNLGSALQDLWQLEDAVKSYRRALELKPDLAEVHNNLGNALQDLEQLDDAVKSYQRALELKPDFAEAHSNLGCVLMCQGKTGEAKEFLVKAIELAPDKAVPLATALTHIPYRQDDLRFDQLETIYAQRDSLPLGERIRLNFSMGKAMENTGQYDRAFSAYEEGNRLHHQIHPFDEVKHESFLKETYQIFTTDLLNKLASLADSLPAVQDERVPVFIVGMPRSGTTLIEQIIASHPAAYGAGELKVFGDIVKRINLFFDPTNLENTLLALRKLGQEYLDRVWKLAPDARYITDKMPGNYSYLGWIHLMLPNAKIVHSMRDPMDTCFSCYALQFSPGQEFSYDLKILGRQYVRYAKLMQHWHNILPSGRILDVRYEDIVADTEREAKLMLDYLGLSWDPACLRFYETERTVRTASVAQVRKPIYSSSVARWKHFERHLEPLIDIILPVKSP